MKTKTQRWQFSLAIACVFGALLFPPRAEAAILINGSFETPAVGNPKILSVNPGGEPSGFGWTVTSPLPNNGNVEVKAQGYVGGNGTLHFDGPAYDGTQWLDLDGFPNPGAIAQSFATTPGVQYSLSFAYANNPFRIGGPASATVFVQNSADNANLLVPVLLSHGTATSTDYHWTLSGPLLFTATGSSTTLRFVSTDVTGDAGIFLDAISVSAVPEPASLAIWGLGALGSVIASYRRRKAA